MTLKLKQDPWSLHFHASRGHQTTRTNDRAAAAAAYDAMVAGRARWLTPPPMPKSGDTRTAAAVALAREIRRGVYVP
jgi:hypothetical protein